MEKKRKKESSFCYDLPRRFATRALRLVPTVGVWRRDF